MSSVRFFEASFVLAHCDHRVLIVPMSPNMPTPDQRSWQEVTDAVLADVPSKMLFALVGTQLQRDLKSHAIRRHDRWVFDRSVEPAIKKLMIEAKSRYLAIRNGGFCQRTLSSSLEAISKGSALSSDFVRPTKGYFSCFCGHKKGVGANLFQLGDHALRN